MSVTAHAISRNVVLAGSPSWLKDSQSSTRGALNRYAIDVFGEALRRPIADDGSALDTDIVVFATGVRPRDELARVAGLAIVGPVLVAGPELITRRS